MIPHVVHCTLVRRRRSEGSGVNSAFAEVRFADRGWMVQVG